MKNCGKDIALAREGSNQDDRFVAALDPNSVKLNDFDLKDWLQFACRFAERVNYFSTLDSAIPESDWTTFFMADEALDDFLKDFENKKNIPPHLALFIAFVRLIEHSQKRFNTLTKRHLDFYYRDILKIEKLPAKPDKVHVIFELAKKAIEHRVPRETALDGGKGPSGKKIIYKTTDEHIVNKAKVSQLKSLYNAPGNDRIKVASVANSLDGKGGDFPDGKPNWWPFGYPNGGTESTHPELDDAKLGFAFSSHVLKIKEGDRLVTLEVKFEESEKQIEITSLSNSLEIWCTGEKGWLGPFSLTEESEKNSRSLKLIFQIPPDQGAVVAYSSKIHGEHFDTDQPICRFLIKTGMSNGYTLYQDLQKKGLTSLKITVDVKGVKSLNLENDYGGLNAEKPFYPFGTQPIKGGSFYIEYPELFEKNWEGMSVSWQWQNLPKLTENGEADFQTWYASYKTQDGVAIVGEDDYFTANCKINKNGQWENTDQTDIGLFAGTKGVFSLIIASPIDNPLYEVEALRFSLNHSFLHELYPQIYAKSILKNPTSPALPNPPYTPLIGSISLDYSATANMKIESKDYQNNPVKLFHEHPFGQGEEHLALKKNLGFLGISANQNFLVPDYNKGGDLFIGLQDAEPLQTMSLLVQLYEGTENPKNDIAPEVEWFILVQNHWKPLAPDYILGDETENFLKSGLVRFSIPKETNLDNTALPPSLIWVKAEIKQKHDAVSQCIAVLAQAEKATYVVEEGDVNHLQKALKAGTISKFVQRISAVKSITQPFSSFDGQPQESDKAYYRRISERLRHKNRAVTLWDYEHLILQEFPDIFKVKCLNHTSGCSFLAPGNVYIVVIPDIVHHNVYDIYQPRVSQARLLEIEKFVDKKNSSLVKIKVANPEYEAVKVSLKVQFHKGFDPHFYKKQLNEDLVGLLAPWAFKKTTPIKFQRTLHVSSVIQYLEHLAYVDFVTNVELFKGNGGIPYNSVAPENPKAILCSVKEHAIGTVTEKCEIPAKSQ